MSAYAIHTLWIWRKSEQGPELHVAWDEYDVDANSQGFEDACAQALKLIGHEVWQHRRVTLLIDYEKVEEAFYEPEISAEVEGCGVMVGDETTKGPDRA